MFLLFTSGYITKYRTKNTMIKTEYDTVFVRATLFYVFLNYLWFFANIIEISAANYKYWESYLSCMALSIYE